MSTLTERRAAGIDAGSNSFLLTILADDGEERILLDRADLVGLGAGVDRQGRLADDAMERAVAQLREYRRICDDQDVTEVGAVGTAAWRDATANRDAFLARVREETGFTIEVISGEREAELTYRDVFWTHGRPGEPLALLDVGGGSSELVRGLDGVIAAQCSLNLGSRRLWERAAPGDPLTDEDLVRARQIADALLADLPPVAGRLVGTGGTITTLAAMKLGLQHYRAAEISAARFSRGELTDLLERLAGLPLAERRRIPGMEPERAETIVTGAIVIERMLVRLALDRLEVSAGGLRMAVAREALGRA